MLFVLYRKEDIPKNDFDEKMKLAYPIGVKDIEFTLI